MLSDELKEKLNKHRAWVDSHGGEGEQLQLYDYTFSGENLSGYTFADARLSSCTFERCCMNMVSFSWAKVYVCKFINSVCRRNNFFAADMRSCAFSDTDMRGAAFWRTDIDCMEIKDSCNVKGVYWHDVRMIGQCEMPFVRVYAQGKDCDTVFLDKQNLEAQNSLNSRIVTFNEFRNYIEKEYGNDAAKVTGGYGLTLMAMDAIGDEHEEGLDIHPRQWSMMQSIRTYKIM